MAEQYPETMTVIEIKRPGGPDALQPVEMRVPHPGENEVLIEIAGAGVNRADIHQRQGTYPPPRDASPIPGLEVSGEVAAAGRGVTRFAPGDKVCALVPGGGYAQYCLAPVETTLPVPDGIDLIEAGGIPETCFTVWTNVFDRARLSAGENVLIHGGASGIGTTAIQMIRAVHNADIFTTAGSDEKCRLLEQLGARRAINHLTEDFVEIIKTETDGRGVDVILDMVGGDYIDRNVKAAARDGRIVNIAYLNGAIAEVDFMPVMVKRLTLTGSTLRPRSLADKALMAEALEQTVWPHFKAGRIKPVVHKTFPLTQAGEAHALMEASSHIGKIILEPGR